MPDESRLNEPPVAAVERRGRSIVVRLTGELDLYNAPDVRAALLEAGGEEPERLVVDLADVAFVDSTALGVFVEARSRLPKRSSFFLAAVGPEPRRALEVSGLDRHLALQGSVEDALSAPL